MARSRLTCLVLLLVATACAGQGPRSVPDEEPTHGLVGPGVWGIVFSDSSGLPLAEAEVGIILSPGDDYRAHMLTEAGGQYAISLPRPGEVRLIVTELGHAGYAELLDIGPGPLRHDVTLEAYCDWDTSSDVSVPIRCD